MRPGRYAVDDGTLARSTGAALGRGLVLLLVAVAIGVVLLNATDADPPGTGVTSGAPGRDDASGAPVATTTSTTTPGTTTTTAALRAPRDVKVLVANGSGTVRGAAQGAVDALKPAGYNVLAPTNAPTTATTAVYHAAGYQREAAALAGVLQLPPASVKALPAPPPIDIRGAQVLVVLGRDHAARFKSSGRATTTTAGRSTTTTTARTTTTTSG